MKLTTGQVLTITDGRVFCDIGEIYEALDGLTGDSLMTHQLPRAGEFAKPYVEEACPWVNDLPPLDLEGVEDKRGVIMEWLDDISEEHGEVHEVPDLSGYWISFDPLEELVAIMREKNERS